MFIAFTMDRLYLCRMLNRFLFPLFVLICIAFGLFGLAFGCLSLQDHFFTQRALFDTNAVIADKSPFAWEMEQHGELLPLERYGMDDLRFEEGQLKARSSNRDPYFWLNLRGRLIDARTYPVFQMRMYSSGNYTLQFHHHALGDGKRVYGTFNIKVIPGWQIIELDLSKRHWQLFPADEASVRQWGGREQIVTGVRLDPVTHQGVDFAIDWVKFLPEPGVEPLEIKPTQQLRSSLLEINLLEQGWESVRSQVAELRGSPAIVMDMTPWRLPQTTLWLREEVQKLAPQAIFFPGPMAFDRLIERAESVSEDIVDPLAEWRGLLLWVSLLSLAAVVLLIAYVKRLSLSLGAYAELCLVLIFSCLLWLLTAQSLDWLFIVSAAGFLLLWGFLLSSRPGNWREKLALTWPARIEVIASASLTVPVALLMLGLSWYYGQLAATDWARLFQGFLIYPLWGIVQQVYLGPILTGLVLACAGGNTDASRRKALVVAIAAGFLFSLAHAPNFALMAATFLIGICWSYLYQRYSSIIPLAISHGILGSLFRELAPSQLQMNGSVGLVHYDWLWF
jgi:hypothetical protein